MQLKLFLHIASKRRVSLLLIILTLCCLAKTSQAQVEIFGGVNSSFVRNDYLRKEGSHRAYHFGAGFDVYPNKKSDKFSLKINVITVEKGYTLKADKSYRYRFKYISVQPMANYHPIPFVSMYAGIDAGFFFWSNVKDGWKNYCPLDAGLVAGFSLWDNKQIGLYTRLIYDLVPMVQNYDNVDAQGNFHGTIDDIKNTSILIGLKINVYNERIPRKKIPKQK